MTNKEIIGYFGIEDTDMFCLKCANNEDVPMDIDNPIKSYGYPDGYTCDECWGTVSTDGAVTNK